MTNGDKIHALKLIKLKIEPPTDNRLGWLETWIHKEDLEAFDSAIKALEQEPTTKNDLGVDCVARQDVERYIEGFINEYTPKEELEFINLELDGLKHLPSVTPQEPILDKIRAEIEQIAKPNKLGGRGNGKSIRYGLCIALEIIDKYKAESEG